MDELGMGPAARFRVIEWPALASALPGIAGLVFMLCATSFAVVLTLGGGPSASTLEVAIYQALRFDFDPARAAALTLTQLALTGLLVTGLQSMGRHQVDRRLVLRLWGRRCGGLVPRCCRLGRRRFDPQPSGIVRYGRNQTDYWPGAYVRRRAANLFPRYRRPTGADSGRLRTDAASDGGI